MNYIDILLFYDHFLKTLRQKVSSERKNMILAVHLGAGMKDGKHEKLRTKIKARESFEKVKSVLDIDFADIGIIQFVTPREYDKIMASKGLIKYLTELIETQSIKHLGISIHDPPTAIKAVESGKFEVLMTQFNLLSLTMPVRMELIQKCKDNNVGLVVIKPFAGGLILKGGNKVKVPAYKSGGVSREFFIPQESTSIRNLAFILDNPSVSSVIPGIKSNEELSQNLYYYNTPLEKRDFKPLVDHFLEKNEF